MWGRTGCDALEERHVGFNRWPGKLAAEADAERWVSGGRDDEIDGTVSYSGHWGGQ